MTSYTIPESGPLGLLRSGVLLAAALAVFDIVGMFLVGLSVPPILVSVLTIALAIATAIGCVWSWRGAAWGTWLAIVARGISALSLVPILFVPDAPKNAIPLSVVATALAVVAIVMLIAGQRRVSVARRVG
jgi:uncharacterized membrane protein (DUF2068 family)